MLSTDCSGVYRGKLSAKNACSASAPLDARDIVKSLEDDRQYKADELELSGGHIGLRVRAGAKLDAKIVKIRDIKNDGLQCWNGGVSIDHLEVNHTLPVKYCDENHPDVAHFFAKSSIHPFELQDEFKDLYIGSADVTVECHGPDDKKNGFVFTENCSNRNIMLFTQGIEFKSDSSLPYFLDMTSGQSVVIGSADFPVDPEKVSNKAIRIGGQKEGCPPCENITIHAYKGLKVVLSESANEATTIFTYEKPIKEEVPEFRPYLEKKVKPMQQLYDRKVFFDSVRGSLFGGSLSQSQVVGMDAIFDAWEEVEQRNINWVAYSFANAFHEVGGTMRAIRELGGDNYLCRMYDISENPRKANQLGNKEPGDGVKFCGRGLTQITGRSNYEYQGAKHGLDLVGNPDLMLDTVLSARVMIYAMIDGDFTGKSFADYTSSSGDFDAVEARRIINGTDDAELIAGYYEKFLSALDASSITERPYHQTQQPEPKSPSVDMTKILEEMAEIKAHVQVKKPHEMPSYYEWANSAPEEPEQNGLTKWLSGKKTHLGMLVSGVIGVAGMFGYIDGMSVEAGASMLQGSFIASGTRSAIPKLIITAATYYARARAR